MANVLFVGPGGFPTISAAVLAANDYDTIRVAPGVYDEQVVIDKPIQLHGAQFNVDARVRRLSYNPSQESIVTTLSPPPAGQVGVFHVIADNVVIDGFSVLENAFGPGIFTSPAFSGYWIFNNIIANNTMGIYLNSNGMTYSQVKQNFLRNNTRPGSASGNGIYSDLGASNIIVSRNLFIRHDPENAAGINFAASASDIVITDNRLVNDSSIALTDTTNVKIKNNVLVNNVGASAIFFGGNTDRTEIENNIIQNNNNGIRVTDFFAPGMPNTNIRAKINTIQGNSIAGLNIVTGAYAISPRRLDATNNWWGSRSGPRRNNPLCPVAGSGDLVIDDACIAEIVPFLTNPISFKEC